MNLETLRHSASHLLAHAIKELYPKVKLGIGPAIENGFYYDFDNLKITEEDLKKIESKMHQIAEEDLKIKKITKTKAEAKKLLKNEKYKLELLEELETKPTFYQQGDFIDLCKGPHVKSTKELKNFKLQKIAGAYWRGNEKNKMLTRIYGTIFPKKEELKEYLHMLVEAEKRDHNKLGKELDLFMFSETVGKGLPLLTPKGATLKTIIRRFIEDEETKRGYLHTITPIIAKSDLYKISGHYDHYKESMFIIKEGKMELALRPMTCPHQFMLYKRKLWSYKELPVRYAEIAELFRKEQTGELHGLIRIWQFTLADAHIICAPEQLEKEFKEVLKLVQYILKTLGLKDFWYRFSKGDPKKKGKYIDNPKAWKESQATLKKILNNLKLKYEEAEDEAAFYGPKLDVQMKNVYGKEDTIITLQIDFALPERFDLEYTDKKGNRTRPMIIHRSSVGCLERTIAILIEHYAGKFPLWLSPIQVKIVTVTDKNLKFAKEIEKQLRKSEIRTELDTRSESIGRKVRDAIKERVPYVITMGEKEQKNKTLAIRSRDNKVRFSVKPEKFIKELLKEIKDKC